MNSSTQAVSPVNDVLRVQDIGFEAPTILLAHHGLELVRVDDDAPIPGSYWGQPEAGVIASTVFARADTPVHSLLHEACHLLTVDPARRASIHTDASDSLEEEDATCYLQIVLADELSGFGRERALADMDAWGYSFRLGSARAWFEHDAEDARRFLEDRGLLPCASPSPPSVLGLGETAGVRGKIWSTVDDPPQHQVPPPHPNPLPRTKPPFGGEGNWAKRRVQSYFS